MEATQEAQDMSLLSKIRPPNLEDAGLEDCALPPDSIHEAFLKAAAAVGSRAKSVFLPHEEEENGGCVKDPLPEKAPDSVVGVMPEGGTPGGCVVGKGGDQSVKGRDLVVGGEVEGKDDVVVVVGGAEEREKSGGGDDGDGDDGGEEKKRPTLVEGYFFNA